MNQGSRVRVQAPSGETGAQAAADYGANADRRAMPSLPSARVRTRAVELGVVERPRILGRLQMREDGGVLELQPQACLDLLGQVVPALDRPRTWHEDVERHERAPTGPACPQ